MAQFKFALDIGESYIKVIDGNLSDKTFCLNSAGFEESIPDFYNTDNKDTRKKIIAIISKLISDSGIKKKDVGIILPDGQSYTKIIEMPSLSKKELYSAIKYQADQFIPKPIDKVSLDISTIYEDKINKKNLVLLVACQNIILQNITEIVESSGLIPVSLENESSATINYLTHFCSIDKETFGEDLVFFINFGYLTSSFYIYDPLINVVLSVNNTSLGLYLFIRDIQVNYTFDLPKIKKLLFEIGFSKSSEYNLEQLLSSPIAGLVSEINKYIISSKEKYKRNINSIYLFGEGSQLNNLPSIIETNLKLPAKIFPVELFLQKNPVADFFKNDLSLFVPSLGCLIE